MGASIIGIFRLMKRTSIQRTFSRPRKRDFYPARPKMTFPENLGQMRPERVGVIVVDHGSRRRESNAMLEAFVGEMAEHLPYGIVEPAHMELAEPSIATAFARCVGRGAELVIVHPYLLFPGRHWDRDIPNQVAGVAASFPHIPYLVTAPLGRHPLLMQVVEDRIRHCVRRACGQAESCDVCRQEQTCRFRSGRSTLSHSDGSPPS